MQVLVAAAAFVLSLAVLAHGQTTAKPGVAYGGVCNGFLLKCDRHQETVLCMARKANATVGGDTCETGTSVDLGRCQCRRNCGGSAIYDEDGEFDAARDRCVGLVGKLCTGLNSFCTAHASCNFQSSKCACTEGYTPTSDGLRCTLATTPTPIVPTTED